MTCKRTENKTTKKCTTNEEYLAAVFSIMKKRDAVVVSSQKTRFNDTELRLLGEILVAKSEGKRLISTQLANRLGVTRSAVSQIVNRLEEERVIVRRPDAVDKKISYVEMTDETLAAYERDIKVCADFVGSLVEEFGKEKFEQMYELLDSFMALIDAKKQKAKLLEKEKKKRK